MGIRINCCPSYFFNQANDNVVIAPDTPIDVIAVTVTTELPNERVRLDSMVETIINTGTAAIYGFNIAYRLFRDTTLLSAVQFIQTNQVKQAGEIATITDIPHITWTDIPFVPGTFTYRIEVTRIPLNEENIVSVVVQDRSIDAIVFPPVNP